MSRLMKERRGTAMIAAETRLGDLHAVLMEMLNKYGPEATTTHYEHISIRYFSPENDYEYSERLKHERMLERRRAGYAKAKATKAEAARIAKEKKEKEKLKELLAKYGSDV